MTNQNKRQIISRRNFLRLATLAGGGAAVVAAGKLANLDRLLDNTENEPIVSGAPAGSVVTQGTVVRLATTDGFMSLPGRDPLYVFGYIDVDPNLPINDIVSAYKGKVQTPSPIIPINENDEVYLTLTNVGFEMRPDLDDAHTVHWHGFRNPTAYFDGVPEASVSVPQGRDFPYYYRPEHPGTYMYHCHFEDVEHVQMGMDGIIYVRPSQNATGTTGGHPPGKYVYNDGDGSTAYDREVTLLLNEIDTRPHDQLLNVQEFVWSDYKPNYWIINGRSYPDTVLPNNDPSLPYQPISSLVQCNPGERVLLRLANLGYAQHSMQLPGIPMKVVGHDATLLRSTSGADLTYYTNSLLIAPGEARDVIIEAPAFDGAAATETDAAGTYNVYYFKNRNYFAQTNNGMPGLGGMVTEIRVYQGSPLPAQSVDDPNETYL